MGQEMYKMSLEMRKCSRMTGGRKGLGATDSAPNPVSSVSKKLCWSATVRVHTGEDAQLPCTHGPTQEVEQAPHSSVWAHQRRSAREDTDWSTGEAGQTTTSGPPGPQAVGHVGCSAHVVSREEAARGPPPPAHIPVNLKRKH